MSRRDKGRRPGVDTTVARFELARANEEKVLAESALKSEQRVSWIRAGAFLLVGASQSILPDWFGETSPLMDAQRKWAIILYGLFCVGALAALNIEKAHKANANRARFLPLPTTVLDTSFYAFMAWHAWDRSKDRVFDSGMLAAALGLVLAFSVARFSWLHVLFSTLLSSVAYSLVCGLTGQASLSRVFFVVFCYLSLGGLFVMLNAEVSGMFLKLRRRDALSRFLPRQVVERVMKLGEEPLQPVQREVTILFSDIRDFTSLSETLQPRQVLELLDDYFGHMSQIVMARDGIVNKFLGDGMLACWGVPDHRQDHAELAMRAALDMRAKLEELNAHRAQHGQPLLRIGIGLHTGVVAAGMLGGREQHEYTVIGDAVNLASRVEGLTKSYGVDILVSESTWRQGHGRFQGEYLGETQVKGRREPVRVHSLQARLPASEHPPAPPVTGS